MRTGRSQLAHALSALLLAGCMVGPALAQRGLGQVRGKGHHAGGENGRQVGARPEAEKKQNRRMPGMLGVPPPWMERLREMSPEDQERFLSNNARFQALPPERQAQIRKRLQQWNSLTPEQRAEVRKREEVWRRMSPEQQRHVRDELLPKWQQLPPERRQAIRRHLAALRGLGDAGRAAKLNDPAFLNGLTPDEQVLLRELVNLRVGTPAEPPQDNR